MACVPPGYRSRRWSLFFSSGLCLSPDRTYPGTLRHSHAFARAAAHAVQPAGVVGAPMHIIMVVR